MQYYLWATRTSADVSVPRLAGFSLISATVPAFQPLDERLAGRKTCKPPARTTRQPAAFCLSMSDSSSDDEGGVCDNYRIDMTHATFGTCKCGFPKSAHKVTTKAGANAKKIVSSLAPAGDKEKPGRPQASLLQKKAAAEESEVRAIRRFFLVPKQASHSL